MFWADEIAARAAEASGAATPQVINDSKTPSGTVHVGSLRGPVIHDEIYRAMRRAEIPARFLYGVDDLDPMDSQALLTPDAVDRYMGVPAGPRAGPRRVSRRQLRAALRGQPVPRHLRAAGHPPRAVLDERGVRLGRHGPLHPGRAGTRRDGADHLPRGEPGREGARLAAALGHLRELRAGGHHPGHRLERRDGVVRVPCRPRDLGHRLWLLRPSRSRSADAPSSRSTWTGRPSGACSASPSRAAARTSPRPAARETDPMRLPARSTVASRRSTSSTSSSTWAASG